MEKLFSESNPTRGGARLGETGHLARLGEAPLGADRRGLLFNA